MVRLYISVFCARLLVFHKRKAECEAAELAVEHLDFSAMSKNCVLHYWQAEAGAARLVAAPPRVYAIEALEEVGKMLFAYTYAVVAELEVIEVVVFVGAYKLAHRALGVGGGIFAPVSYTHLTLPTIEP